MTTPEKIIAKIEEIEKMMHSHDQQPAHVWVNLMWMLEHFKQGCIAYYNLPTADPPEGSPGQSDMG